MQNLFETLQQTAAKLAGETGEPDCECGCRVSNSGKISWVAFIGSDCGTSVTSLPEAIGRAMARRQDALVTLETTARRLNFELVKKGTV